ncbi:MAG: ATP-dependent DNA ligase [Candidatus Heimdallarchaeota archaeon]|nr:MAG: ATP-dependent DNA ligase [Candidatus Heimdallarchaeota archaeon]
MMEKVDSTSKKNEKVTIFASFLRKLSKFELPLICYYATGQPFSNTSENKIQFGWSSFMNVVNQLTSRTPDNLRGFYGTKADFGSLIEYALIKRTPQPKSLDSYFGQNESKELTIEDVNEHLAKIASFKGKGSQKAKKNQLIHLLKYASPLEAKYIARIITSDTRTGFREGLLLDAIAEAFKHHNKGVRYAYMVLSDIGDVAQVARDQSVDLLSLKPRIFHPLRSMLATKAESIDDALENYKSLVCEPKIDGFRAQLHIGKNRCKLYSRNLEDVTHAFPEIIDSISSDLRSRLTPGILDGEVVALLDGKPVFFQDLSTRILRKRDIAISVESTPCYYYVFDILLHQGKSLLDIQLEKRKEILYFSIPDLKNIIKMEHKILENKVDIQNQLQEAIQNGSEGLMLKDPISKYQAGKRGKGWLKLKVTLPTLDLVIVGAEWGHGRRTGWLSNYHLAARDRNDYCVIGKTFKGLKDEEFVQLTEHLQELELSKEPYGISVQPKIVVEVEFDNIQESSKYTSGMALRFARITRIRNDKDLEDVDSIETVRQLFQDQLQRQKRTDKA